MADNVIGEESEMEMDGPYHRRKSQKYRSIRASMDLHVVYIHTQTKVQK